MKVSACRFLGMPITMVVIRSLSDQHLIMELCKNNPHFGLLPHTPSYPFLLPFPDEIWSLSPKNVLNLPIRKGTIVEEIWNISQLFSSGELFWVKLQNIPKVALWWAVSKIMHTFSPCLYNLHKVSLLQHYNIVKKIRIQRCTIQVHTFQPSKIRSSYLQRIADIFFQLCYKPCGFLFL